MTEGDTRARDDWMCSAIWRPTRCAYGFLRSQLATCTSATSAVRCSIGFRQALRRDVRAPGGGHRRGGTLEESYQVLYDSLTWLGLTWDEGPLVGGPYGPYIQTERGDIYREVVARLLAARLAYRCYCTREEIEAREALRPMGCASGYDGFCRNLSEQRIAELEAMSTPSVVRMRVPDADIAFDDLVRGPVRFAAAQGADYVIVRGNGEPLYTLVNPLTIR